jgi:hypothetical protein
VVARGLDLVAEAVDGLSISGNRFTGSARAGDRTGSVEGGSTVHGAFAGTSR